MIALENAVFFVPRIFFCFRPSYSCQISIRFIVKLLTGIEEAAGIEWIIRNNVKNLTRYFKNIQIISEFIHSGRFLQMPSQFNEELIKQILMSLVEYFSMQISDQFFNVAVSHLIQCGDSSSILSNDQQIRTCEDSVYKTLNKREIDMIPNSKNIEIRIHKFFKKMNMYHLQRRLYEF